MSSDPIDYVAFGNSVSFDGDTALVGSPYEANDGVYSGVAYVFIRSGGTWTHQAKLVADDAANWDQFGFSVSLSGDTAVIGAIASDNYRGAVYVFTRSGSTWTQKAKLTASDGAMFDGLGQSVVTDGNTIIAGAPFDSDGGVASGSAYIFTGSGTTWNQHPKIVPGDGSDDDRFGWSVALSGDTVLVGAPGQDEVGKNGSAYAYTWDGSAWGQEAKLTASDGLEQDAFGWSVALDGDTAVVGAVFDDMVVSMDDKGSAYVFTRSGVTWTQQDKLTLTSSEADEHGNFGHSVALDGDVVLVSAPFNDYNDSISGTAYMFTPDGSEWSEQLRLVPSDGGNGDRFGWSVSMSGGAALVGSPYNKDADSGFWGGSVYEFSLNSPPTADIGGPYTVTEGGSIALDGSGSSDQEQPSNTLLYEWDLDNDGQFDDSNLISPAFSAAGMDGPFSTPIALRVTDNAGSSDTATANITIDNADPVIENIVGPAEPLPLGTEATLTVNYSDAGIPDTHTCTFNWGDSAGTVTSASGVGYGAGSCVGSQTYAEAGVYAVGVTVEDDDDGSDSEIYQYIVVYDSSDGFVTGGGWIDSPAGAYAADPSLVGKANFGFVSKYKKGQSTPSGQTQFQFQAGDLNFHSTSYDWLVIAGAKAMFKGSGTINGSGSYEFQINAIDGQVNGGGGVDKFRIKIQEAGNGVIYDNQPNAGDNDDPTTELGGGSIKIHKGK